MKRNLILIRHTKSSWAEPGMRDFDRPIKNDRTEDAEDMARQLNKLCLQPDLILCSPALRTKQTAEHFCNHLPYDYNKILFDMRLYESSAEDYLQVIRETDNKIETLVVIGHNPSITDFANLFLKNKLEDMPTTAVAWLQLENDTWEIGGTSAGKLKHFLTPKTI